MRGITSIILALAFIAVSVTGVQMDIVQDRFKDEGKSLIMKQELANKSNSSIVLIVSEDELFYPRSTHKITGYIFILAGLVHLGFNIRPMRSYLRRRR